MSLASSVYYLIRPKDSLLRMVAECRTEIDSSLTSPQVWERTETTHDLSAPEHRIAYVKALFLAWLHHEHLASMCECTPDDFDLRLKEMLGPEPFTPSVFDQWWSIERFGVDNPSEKEILHYIGAESLRKVTAPGIDYATELLQYWIERKKDDAK